MQYMPLVILVVILIILTILEKLGKNKKPLLRAFMSMVAGFSGFLIINLTGTITGVTIPVSATTLSVSTGLGIPGVTLLLFLNLI